MGKVVKSIFGGPKKPKVSRQATTNLKNDKNRAKRERRRLFKTEGGAEGEELAEGQVRRRDTLLGN